MGRSHSQAIHIHRVDPTDDSVVALILPENTDSLVHETRIPGGFWSFRMTVPMTDLEFWNWRNRRYLYRVRMTDALKVVWEGRLENVSLSPLPGRVELSFRGYYSNFKDVSYVGVTASAVDATKTFSAQRADQIIATMLGEIPSDTIQLSTSTANLENTSTQVTVTYEDYLNFWDMITNQTNGVLTFGNASNQKVDLAVWEDQEVHLKSRTASTVDWITYLSGSTAGVSRFPTRAPFHNVYNAVSVIYSGTTVETEATDTDSITKFIRREKLLPDIGTSNTTTASSLRDRELADQKDLQQESDTISINRVWTAKGVEFPLCRVRAGDVLQIPDFIPSPSALSVTLDAQRTFVVEETTCNHQTGELTLRFDREGSNLADILIRNGIQ